MKQYPRKTLSKLHPPSICNFFLHVSAFPHHHSIHNIECLMLFLPEPHLSRLNMKVYKFLLLFKCKVRLCCTCPDTRSFKVVLGTPRSSTARFTLHPSCTAHIYLFGLSGCLSFPLGETVTAALTFLFFFEHMTSHVHCNTTTDALDIIHSIASL